MYLTGVSPVKIIKCPGKPPPAYFVRHWQHRPLSCVQILCSFLPSQLCYTQGNSANKENIRITFPLPLNHTEQNNTSENRVKTIIIFFKKASKARSVLKSTMHSIDIAILIK